MNHSCNPCTFNCLRDQTTGGCARESKGPGPGTSRRPSRPSCVGYSARSERMKRGPFHVCYFIFLPFFPRRDPHVATPGPETGARERVIDCPGWDSIFFGKLARPWHGRNQYGFSGTRLLRRWHPFWFRLGSGKLNENNEQSRVRSSKHIIT